MKQEYSAGAGRTAEVGIQRARERDLDAIDSLYRELKGDEYEQYARGARKMRARFRRIASTNASDTGTNSAATRCRSSKSSDSRPASAAAMAGGLACAHRLRRRHDEPWFLAGALLFFGDHGAELHANEGEEKGDARGVGAVADSRGCRRGPSRRSALSVLQHVVGGAFEAAADSGAGFAGEQLRGGALNDARDSLLLLQGIEHDFAFAGAVQFLHERRDQVIRELPLGDVGFLEEIDGGFRADFIRQFGIDRMLE